MKAFVAAVVTLISINAHADQNSKTVLDCKAVEIMATKFEESFSVKEWPKVTVEAIDKSSPILPAIINVFEVSIGANSPYLAGQDGVTSVRDQSEGQGHKKYVVAFKDGKTFTIEAQHLGAASLTSSDGSLEATLECQ